MKQVIPSDFPMPTLPADAPRWAWDLINSLGYTLRLLANREDKQVHEGTASEIPEADGSKRFFWATDTTSLYYDDGSWNPITILPPHLEPVYGDVGYTTLAEAKASIGSDLATLIVPPGTVITCAADPAIPSNMGIYFMAGSELHVNTGITATFDGPIYPGPYQIFFYSGTGKVQLGEAVKQRYPQWWGAVGDGTTDDYAAINNALAASEGYTLYFPETGSFYAVSETLEVQSNTIVKIHGHIKLKRSDNLGRPVFRNANAALPSAWASGEPTTGFPADQNISFIGNGLGRIDGDGVSFVKNPGSTPTNFNMSYSGPLGNTDPFYNATGITMVGVKNFYMGGMIIDNPAEWAVRLRCCTDISVVGNNIDTGYGSAHTGTGQSACGSNQDGVHFESCNRVICTGNRSVSSDDRFAVSMYPTEGCRDVIITGNTAISNPTIEENEDDCSLTSAAFMIGHWLDSGTYNYLENINITGNVCVGGNAVRLYSDSPQENEHPMRNISITNNLFRDITESVDVEYGQGWAEAFVVLAGVENLDISYNTMRNYKRRIAYISNIKNSRFSFNTFENMGSAIYSADWPGIWGNDYVGDIINLTIEGNKIYSTIGSSIKFEESYGNIISGLRIINNECISFNSGVADGGSDQYDKAGIKLTGITEVKVVDNYASGNAIGIQPYNCDDIELRENRVESCQLGTRSDCHGIYAENATLGSTKARIIGNSVSDCGGRGIQMTGWKYLEVMGNRCILNNQDGSSESEVFLNQQASEGSITATGFVAENYIVGDGTNSIFGITATPGSGNTISGRLTFGQNSFFGFTETSNYNRSDYGGYSNNIEVWLDTVPPTGGQWRTGDIAWTTGPSGDNPPGAVCTSGGNPGTWKSMAVLAS